MEKTKHIVILAAGDFPSHETPLRTLREADFVVCCDSAYSQFSDFHSQFPIPFIVIGDGDSLSNETKQELGDRWIEVDEQDYNDLHKAVQWAVCHFPPHTSHFTILGATGRREDHTLGNISYLVTFAEEHPGIRLEMLTDYGRFIAVTPLKQSSNQAIKQSNTHIFPSFPGQQVSLFVIDPAVALTSQGLRWPLCQMHPQRWWQATLNEALGTSFTLTSDGPFLLFQTYAPKSL